MTILKLLPIPQVFDATAGSIKGKEYTAENCHAEKLEQALNRRSTLFAEDSLASHTVVPGSAEAKKMTERSGLKCCELLRKSNPVGLLAKMLLASSIWDSTIVYLAWKPKVTKCNRLLFQLAPSTPRTGETGYGLLLATPQAMDASGEGRALKDHIAMLPTPSTKDVSGGAVEAIQTETGFKRVSKQGISHGAQLHDVGKTLGLKLQPAFVEWMMGYPDGWTELTG
jgi:hypothetical protein